MKRRGHSVCGHPIEWHTIARQGQGSGVTLTWVCPSPLVAASRAQEEAAAGEGGDQ